ncbi:MAG: class I SAM-dependent methyltransferase [Chthoniobacterales bacterium]
MSHEDACRSVAALYDEIWLRHYVASKLRRDGVFAAAYELLRESNQPILDIGCGVGLLPFYLRERGCTQLVIGLDIDTRKTQRAREIAAGRYDGVTFLDQNAGAALPQFDGNVTMFDILHYVPQPQQDGLLRDAASRVAGRGMLLLRDCVRDDSLRYRITYWQERAAQAIGWNVKVPFHFVSREEICAPFAPNEFSHEERPMWGGGPFNNYLYIFRRIASAVARAEG